MLLERNNLNYTWILRCSGSSPGHSSEFRTIPNIPRNSLLPIVEIIDEVAWDRYYDALSRQFGAVYVELPLYLNERRNKWWSDSEGQCRNINSQSCLDFFIGNDHRIDVPVVSSQHDNRNIRLDYSVENQLFSQIKDNFNRVGLRIGLPTYDIQSVPTSRTSLVNLLSNMTSSDTLFVDIFNVGSLIQQRLSNLAFVINNTPEQVDHIYILNAFNPDNGEHNFGPYLARYFNVKGFGDFATEKRFPAKVRIGPRIRTFRRNIHFYNWNRFELYTFSEYDSYDRALAHLRSSGVWRNNSDHRARCPACNRIETSDTNNSHNYWKEFRIKHYLYSIVTDTRINDNGIQTAEDLDPIGHDNLFNVGGIA